MYSEHVLGSPRVVSWCIYLFLPLSSAVHNANLNSKETVNTLFNANVHNEADMEKWLDERRPKGDGEVLTLIPGEVLTLSLIGEVLTL